MNRSVVAVDADPYNLAYIRKSLDLEGNTGNVRIIYNSVRYLEIQSAEKIIFSILDWFVYSDEYTELYPYASDGSNVGGTHMKTAQQIKEEKIVTNLVREREGK